MNSQNIFLADFPPERLAKILADPQAKIYLLDKPKTWPSFKLVAIWRKLLGIKKVGFAGTLDPLASGLMILATDSATKMLDLFHRLPKVYEAKIIFGQTSASFDLETPILINDKVLAFDLAKLEQGLHKFLGQQEQVVPIYSAKKVAGQKLHSLARQGKTLEVLPKNKIEIYSLKVLEFTYPNLSLEITCSAGTYIRSLVNDLGKELMTGAVMSDLRRTKIGPYQVQQAIDVANLSLEKVLAAALTPQQIINSLNQD